MNDTYGYLPVAYVKLVPSSDFNVQIGKLYTLQGAENAFTFQNFNVERGLLFNQTSTINRGVQANYAHGPLSVSLALTDGYYSEEVQLAVGNDRLHVLAEGQRHLRRGREPQPQRQVDLRDADRAQQRPALFSQLDAHRWTVDDPALRPVRPCSDARKRRHRCTARRPTAARSSASTASTISGRSPARAEIIKSTGSRQRWRAQPALRAGQRRLVADADADLAEGHLLRSRRRLRTSTPGTSCRASASAPTSPTNRKSAA